VQGYTLVPMVLYGMPIELGVGQHTCQTIFSLFVQHVQLLRLLEHIGDYSDMSKAIVLCKVYKVLRRVVWSIISDGLFWNPEATEYGFQVGNDTEVVQVS